jgi:hypothetical protein
VGTKDFETLPDPRDLRGPRVGFEIASAPVIDGVIPWRSLQWSMSLGWRAA